MKLKVLFDRVEKEMKQVPTYIKEKALRWASDVETFGLEKIRKSSGYHDEPLKGNRAGQRSIRLNRSYRLIYVVIEERIVIIQVLEIHKHEY